jgi:putative toxin-antitoxin system antitoxin component (TIGR02293 family)
MTRRVVAREPAAAFAPVAGAAAAEIVGGKRLFKTKALPQTRAEIHRALVDGVPYAMLVHLVGQLDALSADEVASAVGISGRTLRRHQEQPQKMMAPELASRTWQLAEVLAQASTVFGGRAAAQAWLAAPASGLDAARPIDLLRTLQGAELVTEFLGRLEHGVYA